MSHLVHCSNDGTHIEELNLGNRGLTGSLPDGLVGALPELKFFMVAFNNLTGPVPPMNFSAISGCGYGLRDDCCFLTALNRGVFDEATEEGVTNRFACPLPPGAAEHCAGSCVDDAGNLTPPPKTHRLHITSGEGHDHAHGHDHDHGHEHGHGNGHGHGHGHRDEAEEETEEGEDCQPCVPASNSTYPQCDVEQSLNFGNASLWAQGHISAAYCTADALVVWTDAVPNHGVYLEQIPKPPGSGAPEGDFPIPARFWNTQAFAYRIPLEPELAPDITNYTGAGALAMMVNGVPMYPILGPGETVIDVDLIDSQGHDVRMNMKLDQQLDYCNAHAGRGFDIHYHGDPVCMYEDSDEGHSPIIGWAADGFPLYGKYSLNHEVPTDLDRCNGHSEEGLGYHYHTSTRFPYTIVCWRGKLLNNSVEAGGQPGQTQWAFDNMRSRPDLNDLLPCCDGDSGVRPATARARAPPRSLRRTLRQTDGHSFMFGSEDSGYRDHGHDHDHDHHETGYQIEQQTRTSGVSKASGGGCNGNSSSLLPQDCSAWQDLFDATQGEGWVDCAELREDPCDCITQQGSVVCVEGRITALGLQFNGLNGSFVHIPSSLILFPVLSLGRTWTSILPLASLACCRSLLPHMRNDNCAGTIPTSLANLTGLIGLNLAANHHYLPFAGGLGGTLPPLPFGSYDACGLAGNQFTCPLPPGAAEHCSAGQPLGCI